MTTVANIADYRVVLDGRDLTAAIRPRLVSLTLTDKRNGEADQLDIVLDDGDGLMEIPRAGVTLHVHLGWRQGSDVTVGLVDKGSYIVDEVEHGGPPDQITIRARSADMTSAIRTRREKSWHGTTLGAIVDDVAKRNKLTSRCAPTLASIEIPALAQSRESDMALLRRLGRQHDAVATVKRGVLIFSPIGAGTTPAGRALPSVTIRRRDGDRHSYRVEKRDEGAGVSASWHDRKAAKKKTVTVGGGEKPKHLAKVHGSEAAAKKAATAEHGRTQRAPRKLTFDLALGRPDIYPEQRLKAVGFKSAIDAVPWLIAEVTHTLVAGNGFTTALQMEAV